MGPACYLAVGAPAPLFVVAFLFALRLFYGCSRERFAVLFGMFR